ncbi:MAG: hypothetical protein WCI78_18765 [Mycobacterium sp.]
MVDLLAEELALSGRNNPAEATRGAWARTARVMLAHHKRDFADVLGVISNACADVSWSNAINDMYDIARHWDRLVDTFTKRAPKRFKPRADAMVHEAGPPPVDYSHPSSSLGTVRLEDLANWDEEPVISPDRGPLATDGPPGPELGDRSAILASLRLVSDQRRKSSTRTNLTGS